jgi:hypothetical protein
MSVVIIFVFVFALTMAALASAEPLTPRPVDAISAATLARAAARSPTVRALIAILEQSNVIVHIETSQQLPSGIGGTTRFVTARGGYRYVRISISAELSARSRGVILGHELQHACEIAQSSASDTTGLRAVFARGGHRNGEFFETNAAINIERHVRKELSESAALQAQPVVKFDH